MAKETEQETKEPKASTGAPAGFEITVSANENLVYFGKPGSTIPVPLNLALAESDRRRKLAEIDKIVDAQLKMPPEKLLKLIQYDRKTAPKRQVIDVIRQGIETERIPAERWYFIAGRDGRARIAPDSHGRFLKAQVDPKILTGIEEAFTHMPTQDEPYVTAQVILRYFAGDATFTGTQTKFIAWTADAKEKADTCNKTMTQARGKAARAACPSSFPDVAEEVMDFEVGGAFPAAAGRTVRTTATVAKVIVMRNISDLVSAIYEAKLTDPVDGKLLFSNRDRIAKLVGVDKIEEIGQEGKPTMEQAWDKLQKAVKKP